MNTTPSEVYPDEAIRIRPVKDVPGYFFHEQDSAVVKSQLCSDCAFEGERTILPDASRQSWQNSVNYAMGKIDEVFHSVSLGYNTKNTALRKLALSEELKSWRKDQHEAGRKLPHKGHGLRRIPESVINLLGAKHWAAPLLTRAAVHGSGFTNMLVGAWDAETLYCNYVVDMCFYYEHGYHKAFRGFEKLLQEALQDPRAGGILGGVERRMAADIGRQYIRYKSDAEERNQAYLSKLTARLNREEIRKMSFCESSILGLGAESMARGYDFGAAVYSLIFSALGTDVIDVGSDFYSSELFNSLLNTYNITSTGVISEEALRRVYDAYAHIGATIFTRDRLHPASIMCCTLYTWHILNDRHYFFRRVVLGASQVRIQLSDQRCATWEEAFDEQGQTTGLSRPLPNPCNGNLFCDQFEQFLDRTENKDLFKELWHDLTVAPTEYMTKGVVDEKKEEGMVDGLELAMARAYSRGMIDELRWLLAHANQHAWQVSFLFEAAMFGSLLDDRGLEGRLDRYG